MKLSTRARYGTRALLDLALYSHQGPVQLRDIAHRQGISLSYLEHLVSPLITAGLVRSTRGSRGGVQLARPPREIKLSEVVPLLEGELTLVDCVNNPAACTRSRLCATRDVWGEMSQAIAGVLATTTLQDLMERQRAKEAPGKTTGMYYI
ncbi:MAG: Rrf2 family transcriptional regulator [Chloroflexota bacterium]